jgi:diacylglycerol kinase
MQRGALLLLRVLIGHNLAVATYPVQFTLPMQTSYLTGRLRSFGHAFRGLKVLVQSQHNARIHTVATILVVVAGALIRISLTEWALIALAIVCVWATEALNTAIEFLVDLVSPEHHALAAKAKDVAAGAVLVAAVGALIVGGLVFGPHVLRMLER